MSAEVLGVGALVSSLTFVGIHGISYGMILFLLSVGLVLTMGLMRVINMAHGVFAALGGYFSIALINQWGMPYAAAVVIACAAAAAASLLVEWAFVRPLYGASELEQALLTIGLTFIGIATLNALFGANIVGAPLPPVLRDNVSVLGRPVQGYRIFVICVGALTMAALYLLLDRTQYGARVRAAVDNRTMAEAVGINVRNLFAVSYALGSALAALGGAIGAAILPLEPMYPFKYLILILMVVVMSGRGNIKLAAAVSVVLGVVDTAGRYLYPEAGGFLVYLVLLAYVSVKGPSLLHLSAAK